MYAKEAGYVNPRSHTRTLRVSAKRQDWLVVASKSCYEAVLRMIISAEQPELFPSKANPDAQ